jgi:hypothetical protein
VALNRRVYLVIFVVFLAALAATGAYLRHRTVKAAGAANCDTPAPPPPPTTPPPKLPGFAVEPACGTGAEAPKPAAPTKKTKK